MNQQTELMRSILQNPKAQEIIDWVSPVYGESYAGLWLFEVIGTVLGDVCAIADALRYETVPATAELLLDQWEAHYGLPLGTGQTAELRRAILAAKTQNRGPCNPKRLAAAVSSALGGVEVDIQERVAKNTFLVNIREVVDDITPAVWVLERRKPAHLLYQIRVATQMVTDAEIKVAIALTHSEQYKIDVV